MKECTKCGESVRANNSTGLCGNCRDSQLIPFVPEWRKLRDDGVTLAEISRRYGIDKSTVSRHVPHPHGSSMRAREDTAASVVEGLAAQAWRVFDVPPGAIWTRSRLPKIVRARHAVFLVAVELGVSNAAVGRVFEYDHTSICNGRLVAENFASRNPDYAAGIETLRECAQSLPQFVAQQTQIFPHADSSCSKWMPSSNGGPAPC